MHFKNKLLALVFILFFFQSNGQQDSVKNEQFLIFGDSTHAKKDLIALTGSVINAATGDPIAGVHIYSGGLLKGATDEQGRYYVSLEYGAHRIIFRHVAMYAQQFQIKIFELASLSVKLSEKTYQLEGIVISGEEIDKNINRILPGTINMPVAMVQSIPSLAGEPDIVKVLQLQPGITSVGEGSSGFNVRGGKTDQNLTLLNEAILLNLNHAMGFLSPYNPDFVETFDLYKGGIPAYFGGRSASTLNVTTKKGNFTNWSISPSLGTAVTKFKIDGPILKDKISVLAAGRISNANWLLKKVKQNETVSNSNINFFDTFGSISGRFRNKHFIDAHWLSTGDSFRLSQDFGFKWSSQMVSLTTKHLISNRLSLSGLMAIGATSNTYYTIQSPESLTNKTGINYNQLKTNLFWTLKKTDLTVGLESTWIKNTPEVQQPFKGQGSKQSIKKSNGNEFSVFIQDEWSPIDFLGISIGMRVSQFTQFGVDSLFTYRSNKPRIVNNIIDTLLHAPKKIFYGWEPRLSAKINISKSQSIKFSYNHIYQYLHTLSNTTSPTPVDLWQVSGNHIKPQQSYNYSVGFFQNLKQNMWAISVEGFYRLSKNQLEYKDFADLTMNKHIETELLAGSGRAYGIEWQAKKNSGHWTGWISYTYSRSFSRVQSEFLEEQINHGAWYPSNHDRPHSFSIMLNRKIYPRSAFNLSTTYVSGRPLSIIDSYYVVNNAVVPNYTSRNEFRIPNYFRVDLSVELGNVFAKVDDKLSFGLYNLFSRRNAYSVYFKRYADRTRLVPYQLSLLGTILPSIVYTMTIRPTNK